MRADVVAMCMGIIDSTQKLVTSSSDLQIPKDKTSAAINALVINPKIYPAVQQQQLKPKCSSVHHNKQLCFITEAI